MPPISSFHEGLLVGVFIRRTEDGSKPLLDRSPQPGRGIPDQVENRRGDIGEVERGLRSASLGAAAQLIRAADSYPSSK
jgi:hypothetical protein